MFKFVALGGTLIFLAFALLASVAGPMIARITAESTTVAEAAAENIASLIEQKELDKLKEVELNEHALERHGDIAQQAREAICKSSNVKELKGINDFDGFNLFWCTLESSSKIAVWVLIKENGALRTITAFISKGESYIKSLVDKGRYVLP